MALKFQPKEKSVVICDYRSGFVAPEMVKRRPVVVLKRHPTNSQLVTIVSLSTTEPTIRDKHHHELPVNPLPDQVGVRSWAKCDMVATVSLARLELYKARAYGKRTYQQLAVGDHDFQRIKECVHHALGLNAHAPVPVLDASQGCKKTI